MDKVPNKIVLVRITFHLLQAMRYCNQLDLSELPRSEQEGWDDRIKLCKNALDFTKETVQRLGEIISP
ncbi:MAG: hypothetical protein ACXWM6_12340 [Thermodesulfobacteriota bacterium]